MDDTTMIKKRDDFQKQAEKLNHDQAVSAAHADIEAKKEALKEAEDVADKAAASDGGMVGVPQPGPEAVRTEALVMQAQEDLDKAETALHTLEKGTEPAPAAAPVAKK